MTGPRIKRQFVGAASDPAQRQITSFFNRTDGPTIPSKSGPLNGPALPASVQTNLLNVGMRVRKSVSEGYKTTPKTKDFSVLTDKQTSPALDSLARNRNMIPCTVATSRELAPFCGIHKTGGLEATNMYNDMASIASSPPSSPPRHSRRGSPCLSVHADCDDLDHGLNQPPGLTSSQSTIGSTVSFGSPSATPSTFLKNTRKRQSTSDEHIGDVPHWLHANSTHTKEEWLGNPVSPSGLQPAGWNPNARIVSVPRTKNRKNTQLVDKAGQQVLCFMRSGGSQFLGQENVRIGHDPDGDDFEEAAFLNQRWALDDAMDVDRVDC